LNKQIDTKLKAAISGAIQAYLTQHFIVKVEEPNNRINAWKLFTSSNYNVLRNSKPNPWKNSAGYYD